MKISTMQIAVSYYKFSLKLLISLITNFVFHLMWKGKKLSLHKTKNVLVFVVANVALYSE